MWWLKPKPEPQVEVRESQPFTDAITEAIVASAGGTTPLTRRLSLPSRPPPVYMQDVSPAQK